jgi:CDP-diacylglycerol---glycerol-3-phosphate 3-phosphatidyltransferase
MFTKRSGVLEAQGELISLHKRWLIFTLTSILALGGIFVLLFNAWEPHNSIRWLITSSIGLSVLLWVLWQNLDQNYRPGEVSLLPTFGPGNSLTLLRGTLLAMLAGFLFLPQPENILTWSPAIIFTLAIAADFFDGFAARVSNHVTRLGEALDMKLDGVGVLIAIILAVQYGSLPAWYLLVASARYLYLAGIYIREKKAYPVYELPPSIRRRAFAGLQMGFVSAMLWPIFTPPGTSVAALIFAIPFLSGFLLDWLYASGVLQASTGQNLASASRLLNRALPIALRLVLIAVIPVLVWERFQSYSNPDPAYSAITQFSPEIAWLMLFTLEIIGMLLVVIGAAGRVVSIAGLLLIGINQFYASLHPLQYLLIVLYISIIYLGTGPYSLWKPEDRLIYRQAGTPGRLPAQPVDQRHPGTEGA